MVAMLRLNPCVTWPTRISFGLRLTDQRSWRPSWQDYLHCEPRRPKHQLDEYVQNQIAKQVSKDHAQDADQRANFQSLKKRV